MNMAKTHPILADVSAGISELKKNPMVVVEQGDGAPVAIIDRNEPVFYAVPAAAYELLMDKLEDMELAAIVEARKDQPEIEVNIEDRFPRKLGGSWEGKVEIVEDFDNSSGTLTDGFYGSSIFSENE